MLKVVNQILIINDELEKRFDGKVGAPSENFERAGFASLFEQMTPADWTRVFEFK